MTVDARFQAQANLVVSGCLIVARKARIARLTAVHWKLRNLRSKKTSQRLAAQERLHAVLETYRR